MPSEGPEKLEALQVPSRLLSPYFQISDISIEYMGESCVQKSDMRNIKTPFQELGVIGEWFFCYNTCVKGFQGLFALSYQGWNLACAARILEYDPRQLIRLENSGLKLSMSLRKDPGGRVKIYEEESHGMASFGRMYRLKRQEVKGVLIP